jgi:hypothetical protein
MDGADGSGNPARIYIERGETAILIATEDSILDLLVEHSGTLRESSQA